MLFLIFYFYFRRTVAEEKVLWARPAEGCSDTEFQVKLAMDWASGGGYQEGETAPSVFVTRAFP